MASKHLQQLRANAVQARTERMNQISSWQGSQKTALMVKSQIAERWGEEEADKYDPETNCHTFNAWRAKGYHVKKGEKALRSFTYVTKPGEAEGDESSTYPKGVCLFYVLQVEKREEKQS